MKNMNPPCPRVQVSKAIQAIPDNDTDILWHGLQMAEAIVRASSVVGRSHILDGLSLIMGSYILADQVHERNNWLRSALIGEFLDWFQEQPNFGTYALVRLCIGSEKDLLPTKDDLHLAVSRISPDEEAVNQAFFYPMLEVFSERL